MSFFDCKIVAVGADPAKYRAQPVERGDVKFVVSSSCLREFDKCPRRWKAGYESSESKSTKWGSLFDCRLLTPDQFNMRYRIQPETYTSTKGEVKDWSNNATVCKEWNEAVREEGMEIATHSEIEECDKAIARMMDDPILRVWHLSCDTQVWVQGHWKDEETQMVIPVKCLIDYVPRLDTEYCKSLGDLKSSRSGIPSAWAKHVFNYGYHIQAAFNIALYVAATGEDRCTWVWVGQENYPPYEPFREMMSEDFLINGNNSYQRMLARYARCLKSGKWPGYDDHADAIQGWSLCRPMPYMEYEEVSRNMEGDAEAQDDSPDIVP